MIGRPWKGERYMLDGRVVEVIKVVQTAGGDCVAYRIMGLSVLAPALPMDRWFATAKPVPAQEARFAITLTRPWAAMCTIGPKDIENRDWTPPPGMVGQRVAIHAGLKFDYADWELCKELMQKLGIEWWDNRPLMALNSVASAIVGTAVIAGVVDKDVPGSGTRTDAIPNAATSPWFFGRYGWLLTERQAIAAPVPVRGYQKLWHMPDDVAAAVAAQTLVQS